MISPNYLKAAFVFIALAMTFCINLPDNIMARSGIEASYALSVVCALLITLIVSHHSFLLASCIILVSLVANMPVDFSLNFGLDRDIFTNLMMFLLAVPFISHFID